MRRKILVNIVAVVIVFCGSALRSNSDFVDWENMGIYGGTLRDVAVDSIMGAIYAGFNGGLYKTTDGGNTWEKILDYGCPAVSIDSTSGTIYASGQGLVKSIDGGNTWENVIGQDDATYAKSTSEIKIAPNNNKVIYIGTGGSVTEVNDARIYKSIDAGKTWAELGLTQDTEIWSIAVDFNDNDIIYVAEQDRIYNPDGHVWKSIDGGANWTDISPVGDGDFAAVAVDPNNSNIVYVGTAPPSTIGHLYKSTDGGSTWEIKLDSYIEGIAIDPTNTSIVYAGNHKSTDGGNTWVVIPDPVNPGGHITIDPTNSSILYAGSGQGIAKSTDSGTNWIEISNGIEEVVVKDAIRSPDNTNIIYVAAQEGFAKSIDNASNWDFPIETVMHSALALHSVAAMSLNGLDIVYVGAEFGNLDRSTDSGVTWTAVPLKDCPEYDDIENITSISFHPSDVDTVFVSSAEPVNGIDGGIYKSTDGGTTWACELQNKPCNYLVTTDGQTLYAGIGDSHAGRTAGGIYKSSDGGFSWGPSGLEDKIVLNIKIDKNDPDILYAGTGDSYRITTCAVYRSTNGGISWEDISTKSFSFFVGKKGTVSAMYLDSDEDTLYVAISKFIFRGTNASNESISWSYVETDFKSINALLPGSLYAGTDKGLFRFTGTEWLDTARDTQPGGGAGAGNGGGGGSCFIMTSKFM